MTLEATGAATPDTPGSAATARPIRREAFIMFAVALLAWTMTNMDQSLFAYAIPELMTAFGFTLQTIGLMISLSFVVGIFAASLAGWATDLVGPRVTLPVCLAASALFVGLQGLATSAVMFAVIRTVGYAFSAGLSPICNSIVANVAPPRHRRILVAVLQCGYPMGWFIASFIVAPLITESGWRAPFLVGFAVIPLAFLCAWLMPPRRVRSQTAQQSTPVRQLFSQHRREAIISTLAFFAYGGAIAGTVLYLPTLFQAVRGYDAGTAAYIVGLSYGIGMIGYIASAVVGEKLLGSRNTTVLWCMMAAISFVAMLWLPRTQSQDIIAFGITALFFYGTSSIITTYLMEIFPREVRASAAGICASGGLCTGSVIFPTVVAALVPLMGWQWAMAAVAVPLLLICAGLIAMLPRYPVHIDS